MERVFAGEELGEQDHTWITSSGESMLVAWACIPLPQIDERRLFLVSGVDVTLRKRQEEELRASRSRIMEAGLAERRRLERNLHDGAQQRLVSLSLALRLAKAKLSKDPPGAEELLAAAADELNQALEELRELARGIHPAVLTDRGLEPALQALAQRSTIPVDIETPPRRLPAQVEAAAYYVVSEALANVAKYAQASSVSVRVAHENGRVLVGVKDDGVGGADPTRGTGLRGLSDRIAALDGRLEVESRPGQGTTVRAEIPVREAASAE
jgi:signal transduction histidine kinase